LDRWIGELIGVSRTVAREGLLQVPVSEPCASPRIAEIDSVLAVFECSRIEAWASVSVRVRKVATKVEFIGDAGWKRESGVVKWNE
jgi:hypothetical protein